MSRHRAEGGLPLSDSEIFEALKAVTIGDAPYTKRFEAFGRSVKIENRGPHARMGRFGGGWERELGLQLGGRGLQGTIIVNLWKGSIRIDPKRA